MEPTAIEIYRGEWKNDSRTGYGICERSDGIRYIGEWLENKRHGYGVTFFKEGTLVFFHEINLKDEIYENI